MNDHAPFPSRQRNLANPLVCLTQALWLLLLFTAPLAQATSPTSAEVTSYNQTFPTMEADELLRLVSRGNALAQHELANRLASGQKGFPKNARAAAMWYTRAAQRGTPGSASLDPLPRGPVRAGRQTNQVNNPPPVAQLAAMDPSQALQLVHSVDGSGSTDDQGIVKYVWDVQGDGPGTASLSVLSPGQAQIAFPRTGRWFVTLIVVDAHGQLDQATQLFELEEPLLPPTTPVAISPADKADLVIDVVADFQWEHQPQVQSYDFHFFNNAPTGPRGPRGARQPFVSNLQPDELCSAGVCTLAQLVDLPEFANHAWRVRARNAAGLSGWSRTLFNVVQPVTAPPLVPALLSPQADVILEAGSTLRFEWSAAEGATAYEFVLLDLADDNFEGPNAFIPASNCSGDTCSIRVVLENYPLAETYQWQVTARNAAGASDTASRDFSIIEAATAAPASLTMLAPLPNAQLVAGTPATFEWEHDQNAVYYDFHFFDSVTRDTTPFVEGLLARDVCVDNRCSTTQSVDVSVGSRQAWRVRARNSLGSSGWSRTLFDAIEPLTEPPADFTLLAPASGASLEAGLPIEFRWQHALRTTAFDIVVYDASAPNSAPFTATVPASSCEADRCQFTLEASLPIADNHQWKVKASNAIGETVSGLSSFSVAQDSIDPLNAPTLVTPLANALITQGSNVVFEWQSVAEATGYDFYLKDAVEGAQPVQENLLAETLCSNGLCTYTTPVNLTASENHSWHVRAKADDLASPWSDRALSVVDAATGTPPVARFSIDGFAAGAAGAAPLTLSFDPSQSSDDVGIESFTWDFGDDSEAVATNTAETVTHTFASPGNYEVTLTVTDSEELTHSARASVRALDPATAVTANDAARLLAQASFGATRQSLLQVQSLGMENWLEQQFTLQGPPHLNYVSIHSNGSGRAPRHEIWWRDVIDGDDQLRQRVAFALSQIFVISDTGYTLSNSQYGITHYYDILREHAFGNYRDLLEQVTLSPVMGLYLSMLQNAKGDPESSTRADENYAREVLQLFSIGLHVLNLDGTTDGSPVFTQDHIEAFARVFTGWNYRDAGRWNRVPFTGANLIDPMEPFEDYHDTDAKELLGGVVAPAGLTARQDLELALDNIFNHPNVGPFIGKQLIKRLVTSNPSPAYVERVARVFNDNGEGVRGDLEAVVRAILLDEEARQIPDIAGYGKLREPVIRLSHLWRAFNVQRGNGSSSRGEYNTHSPQLMNLELVTGQAVLKSPSVFNFFQPSFSPAGPVAAANLKAPEFELSTDSNELATTNRIGRQILELSVSSETANGLSASYLDFSHEVSLAGDIPALLTHLDTLLLSGSMSETLTDTLTRHLEGLPDTQSGHFQRVRDAVALIVASPDYLIQM